MNEPGKGRNVPSLTLVACVFAGVLIACCATASKASKEGGIAAAAGDAQAAAALPERIPADDPAIEYSGRIDASDPKAPAFAFPGVLIAARFQGKGIDVVLEDSGDKDYFNVSIDGGEPMVIRTVRGEKAFPAARKLRAGEHDIRIYKRTEANQGTVVFRGFNLEAGKKLVEAPPLPGRKLEFIGDSITCGYGNMVSTDKPDSFHFTPDEENSELSWGAVAAKALGAQFMSTSYSGRGLFRNIDGSERGALPRLYEAVFPDQPERAAWDPERYVPDVIVINLGTNDHSSQLVKKDLQPSDFDARFVKAYQAFIRELRGHYPRAKIICAVGPMMSDWYPPGAKSWTRIQSAVSGVVDDLKEGGDENMGYLCLDPQNPPYGQDWHPTAATHAAMAEAVTALIREMTGW
jgi:lysophospholipase L1-like esterase